MLPKCKRFSLRLGLMAALLLAWAVPASAQNAVRGPVGVPVPLTFADPAAAAANAPAAHAPAQQAPAAKTDEPQPKFPNKDTAKNRQDYDMGTGTGTIQLGRDDATGDTVMRHNPPQKTQEPYPLEQQPIQVWPTVTPAGRPHH